MAQSQPALIFIPDISGFTKFVTETEIDHSTHIIEELLEIIIDSNQTDLELSEIEGDAVLFYRFGQPPSTQEIVKQSKEMFIKFHEHLKLYERDRVCHCGACSTAQDLTLKMIAHYGELSELKVKDKSKLLGEDMITAHRLLKNDVNNDEYLLLSGKFIDACTNNDLSDENWVELQKGSNTYDEIGLVDYCYTKLTPLHELVEVPEPHAVPERSENPIVIERSAKVPLKWLYEVVTNADYKPLISEIEITKDAALPRVGNGHECILPQGTIHFKTIEAQVNEGEITYGESVTDFPILGEVTFINEMKKVDDKNSTMRVEIHFFPDGLIDKLKFQAFKLLAQGNIAKGVEQGIKFAEKTEPAF